MNRKLFAIGLLVAVCMGFLAVDGTSQAPLSPAPTTPAVGYAPPAVGPAPLATPALPPPSGEASFESLVQELKNVRAQQEALKAHEKVLLDKIAQKVEEQRKALQKSEEILRQLQPSFPDAKPSHLRIRIDKKDYSEKKEEKKER